MSESSGKRWSSDWPQWLAFVLLVVLCAGSPDILDGLIKRANNIQTCPQVSK